MKSTTKKMIKQPLVPIVFILSLLQLSCDTTEEIQQTPEPNCTEIVTGLLSYDNEKLEPLFDELTADLLPVGTTDDPIGHTKNLQTLIDRLNQCSLISAELICYACIKTYPAQSELLITIDPANQNAKRVVDIFTPENDTLSFAGIHEYTGNVISLDESNYLDCFYYTEFEKNQKIKLTGTDTLYYTIENDTLTLNAIIEYSCGRTLTDSVIIEANQVKIYIADTSSSDEFANCICNYGFTYKFTGFWQKNTYFYVYKNDYFDKEYSLWKETSFIDGLD